MDDGEEEEAEEEGWGDLHSLGGEFLRFRRFPSSIDLVTVEEYLVLTSFGLG